LLLKSLIELDESRDEQQRLNEALELNQPLAIAYYLKIYDNFGSKMAKLRLKPSSMLGSAKTSVLKSPS